MVGSGQLYIVDSLFLNLSVIGSGFKPTGGSLPSLLDAHRVIGRFLYYKAVSGEYLSSDMV